MGLNPSELRRAGLVETKAGIEKLADTQLAAAAVIVVDLAEKSLQQDIINECHRRHWLVLRGSMAHKAKRTPGEPDLVVAADYGITYFIECKVARNKLSDDQQAVRHALLALGHRHLECRSLQGFVEFVAKTEVER